MHRACLADETGAKRGHHPSGLHHGAVKSRDIIRIVLRVRMILLERDGVSDFARHGPDMHVDAKPAQPFHELGIEVGHRHGTQCKGLDAAVAGQDAKLMAEQIEIDVERATRIGVSRRDEAARVHGEGDIPPMIDRRRELQPHLAGHLRPKLQRVARVAPGGERQIRPKFGRGHARSSSAARRKV